MMALARLARSGEKSAAVRGAARRRCCAPYRRSAVSSTRFEPSLMLACVRLAFLSGENSTAARRRYCTPVSSTRFEPSLRRVLPRGASLEKSPEKMTKSPEKMTKLGR